MNTFSQSTIQQTNKKDTATRSFYIFLKRIHTFDYVNGSLNHISKLAPVSLFLCLETIAATELQSEKNNLFLLSFVVQQKAQHVLMILHYMNPSVLSALIGVLRAEQSFDNHYNWVILSTQLVPGY